MGATRSGAGVINTSASPVGSALPSSPVGGRGRKPYPLGTAPCPKGGRVRSVGLGLTAPVPEPGEPRSKTAAVVTAGVGIVWWCERRACIGSGPSPGVRAKLFAGLIDPTLLLEDCSCRSSGALTGTEGSTFGTSGTDLGWLAATKPDEYGLPSDPVAAGMAFLPSSSMLDNDGRC